MHASRLSTLHAMIAWCVWLQAGDRSHLRGSLGGTGYSACGAAAAKPTFVQVIVQGPKAAFVRWRPSCLGAPRNCDVMEAACSSADRKGSSCHGSPSAASACRARSVNRVQSEPRPTRPEALRRLAELTLERTSDRALKARSGSELDSDGNSCGSFPGNPRPGWPDRS